MSEQNYIRSRWFEDIPIGEFHVFGSYTLSEKEILAFNRLYATGDHHNDPEKACGSFYKGLIASEWHLTAIWMKMMVSYMERYAAGVQDGRRGGAGIGLYNMHWQKPVRPGHTLTFTYEIINKSDKIVGDKWSIIRSRNEAFNQNNVKVLQFEAEILAERAPS